MEAVTALILPRRTFTDLRDHHPAFDRFVIALLVTTVERLSAQLVEALYATAEQRVLRRVLLLHDAAPPRPPGETIVIKITQDEMATMAGVDRPTANRVLAGRGGPRPRRPRPRSHHGARSRHHRKTPRRVTLHSVERTRSETWTSGEHRFFMSH